MKPLSIVACIMLFATSANGAILRMDFGGGADEKTISPFVAFEVDIWIDLVAISGDPIEIDGLTTDFVGATGLQIIGASTSLPGWDATFVPGTLTPGAGSISVNAQPGADPIVWAGSFLVCTMLVNLPVPEFNSYSFTFNSPGATQSLSYNNGLSKLLYHSVYGASYDSYYLFGLGSPFVAASMNPPPGHPGQPAQPLFVYTIPEPAALALLGVGALCALRGRQ